MGARRVIVYSPRREMLETVAGMLAAAQLPCESVTGIREAVGSLGISQPPTLLVFDCGPDDAEDVDLLRNFAWGTAHRVLFLTTSGSVAIPPAIGTRLVKPLFTDTALAETVRRLLPLQGGAARSAEALTPAR